MSDVILENDIDLVDETTDPIHSHIVDRGDDPRPAEAIILEARVNGTPVTAICGYVWVPSRDPQKHPICPKCEEIFPFVANYRL